MKLPPVGYRAPVQSLGRESARPAISATLAKTEVLDSAVEIVEAHEYAEQSAKLQQSATRLLTEETKLRNALVNNTKIPASDIPRQLKKKLGITDKEAYVDTYRVSTELYDHRMTEISNEIEGELSPKFREEFNRMVFSQRRMGVEKVVQDQQQKWKSAQRTTFDTSIRLARELERDEAIARTTEIISQGHQAGIYDLAEHDEMMIESREAIDYKHFQDQLVTEDDPEELGALVTEIVEGENTFLSDAQIKDLTGRYMSRIKSLRDEEQARVKEDRRRESKQTLAESIVSIRDGGGLPSYSELLDMGMEAEDVIALTGFMAGVEEERKTESTAEARNEADFIVTDVRMAHLNQEDAIERLNNLRQTGDISGEDYGQAMSDIVQAEAIATSDPTFRQVEESIYLMIGRASRDQFSSGADPEIAVYLNEARNALYAAARSQGATFNAADWWERNQRQFLPPSYDEAAYQQYMILDDSGRLDFKATMDNINGISGADMTNRKAGAMRLANQIRLSEME